MASDADSLKEYFQSFISLSVFNFFFSVLIWSAVEEAIYAYVVIDIVSLALPNLVYSYGAWGSG